MYWNQTRWSRAPEFSHQVAAHQHLATEATCEELGMECAVGRVLIHHLKARVCSDSFAVLPSGDVVSPECPDEIFENGGDQQ